MFGLITRRRFERETAGLRAKITVAIEQRDNARAERDAFRAVARASARQFAEADAANRRLVGRVEELGKRNSALTESDPEYAADLERRLDRALRACARWMNATWAATRRADRLQNRLDDAVGMPHGGHIRDSGPWQPGFERPTPGATS
ncbi:hypothetical protein [Streptomyces sp. SID5910]|uniref:hypothetical protein n=1 Tax=Streptomyces sp. SID5910 TaxID=2690312 RepID=UPI00137073FB|nr:hypothetical protein [Streptomyces sp. SID5910]MYR46758.1 hypothetical protein [Streptomyces sp. SID5910]